MYNIVLLCRYSLNYNVKMIINCKFNSISYGSKSYTTTTTDYWWCTFLERNVMHINIVHTFSIEHTIYRPSIHKAIYCWCIVV